MTKLQSLVVHVSVLLFPFLAACGPSGTCSEGEVACNGVCMRLATDEANCGSCGNACLPSATCEAGACAGGNTGPRLSLVTPASGLYLGGGRATLDGMGFVSNPTVTFGSVAATRVTVVSDTRITCDIPAHAVGGVDVEVRLGEQMLKLANGYNYRDFSTVTTVAGTGQAGDADGKGDVATFSNLLSDIAVEGSRAYISDGGKHALRVLDFSAVDPLAPKPVNVTVSSLGVGTALVAPDGLALVDGVAWVADTDWVNNGNVPAIRTVNLSSGAVETKVPNLQRMGGLAWYGGSDAYFVECETRFDVRKLDMLTGTVTSLVGGGPGDVVGAAADTLFRCPWGLTFSADGTALYVADWGNHRIKRVTVATGASERFVGTGTVGDMDSADGAQSSFQNPTRFARVGNELFVADSENCKVRRVDLTTKAVSTVAGVAGSCGSGDGPLATAQLNTVTAVAWVPGLGLLVTGSTWGYGSWPVDRKVRLVH